MAGYIKLSRDCPAMLIPSGMKVLLMGGCEVIITHKLAGTFTVLGNFGMARIDGENADALGLESPKADNPAGAAKLSACATASFHWASCARCASRSGRLYSSVENL